MATQRVAEVNTIVLGFSYGANLDSLSLHPLDLLHIRVCVAQNSLILAYNGIIPCLLLRSLVMLGFVSSRAKLSSSMTSNFKNGVLSLPVFKAHDDTKKHLLNLLAFEKLYPCTGHEVPSYTCFMDNLVNTRRDVELLRSKGVIKNLLSSRGGSRGARAPLPIPEKWNPLEPP